MHFDNNVCPTLKRSAVDPLHLVNDIMLLDKGCEVTFQTSLDFRGNSFFKYT